MDYSKLYWEDVKKAIECIPGYSKLKNKTILITGGTGMICSAVVDVLLCLNRERHFNINILLAGRSLERTKTRFQSFSEGKDYRFITYDATETKNLDFGDNKIDYIIHGASNANPVLYTKQPVETMMANIIGLQRLLKLATKNKDCRLLYISSSEVYGKKDEAGPYDEMDYGFVDILNPRSCYPNAKRVAETLCVAYGEEYDVDTVIVRPGHIYGPTISKYDARASAQFTWNAVNGDDIVMKSMGVQLRSYCYTLDCASAILTVLLRGEKANAYNISNPNSVVTIRQIADALAKAGNVKVAFDVSTEEEKKGYNLMSNSSLTSVKLEHLGWKPTFSLEEGANKTVLFLKDAK